MPRQNFLSTDFFVSASEQEAKRAVCSLPEHLPHIKLLKENMLAQSIRFLYEHPDKSMHNYMDVSILPLNDQYVRFSLHASYANGQAFYSDPDISNALYHFEQSVYAALKNDFSELRSIEKKKSFAKTSSWFTSSFFSAIGFLFLWKKFS